MKQSDREKLLTELQGAETLLEVVTLYRGGLSQVDIGKRYGVGQSAVSTWLAQVRIHWLNSAIRNWDALKELELLEIAKTEQAAWQGWERSLKPKRTTTRESGGMLQGSNLEEDLVKPLPLPKGQPVNMVVKKEDGTGDPRFLAIVMKCIERRCAILGLDAPTKVEGKVTVNWRDEFQQQGKDGDQFMMVVMQIAALVIEKPAEQQALLIESIGKLVEST